ncbi:MAG TPA: archaellin/type IV pilin N-terminal domain-containing protein, partial [Thermoplasmata archaeon]|nr:archaellin/type IV pilin N-terminal domain-containing protein [Thermoplasmata archaeon]
MSGVIATILLLAITLVLVVVLSLFRPNLSTASPQIYINVLGSQTEQAWGDPTDCSNTSSHAQCNALPA